jgi:hypothetical protein
MPKSNSILFPVSSITLKTEKNKKKKKSNEQSTAKHCTKVPAGRAQRQEFIQFRYIFRV